MTFKIITKKGNARVGVLKTAHGELETPAFFAVATQAAVKGITSEQLTAIGVNSIIVNTYHLFVRDAVSAVKNAGGLHKFMDFYSLRSNLAELEDRRQPNSGVIATDSGGFQVFSLGAGKKHNVGKIHHEHNREFGGIPRSDLLRPTKDRPRHDSRGSTL